MCFVSVRLVPLNLFKPSGILFTDRAYLLFMFHVCLFLFCVALSFFILCRLVISCLERGDLLALLFVMFSCVLVTFSYVVPGQV